MKMEVFFKRTLNSQEHPPHKSTQLIRAPNSQKHLAHKNPKLIEAPTSQEFAMNTTRDTQWAPWTLEVIMEVLHIHAWPKHYGMHCTLQSLHIQQKH